MHRDLSRPEDGSYFFKFPPWLNLIEATQFGEKKEEESAREFIGMNHEKKVVGPNDLIFDS
jgi:hypothetical protein